MEFILQATVKLELQTCITCGVHFGLPKEMDNKLRESRNNFYCPNGHQQHYCGETEAQKLMKELKRKEQELADQVQEKLRTQSELNTVQRKLKRVSKGVCPCCNRSFPNLHNHMKTKHPELIKNGK